MTVHNMDDREGVANGQVAGDVVVQMRCNVVLPSTAVLCRGQLYLPREVS